MKESQWDQNNSWKTRNEGQESILRGKENQLVSLGRSGLSIQPAIYYPGNKAVYLQARKALTA